MGASLCKGPVVEGDGVPKEGMPGLSARKARELDGVSWGDGLSRDWAL